MTHHLRDLADWLLLHDMPHQGVRVGPSAISAYDHAAAVGLCERGDTNEWGFVSFTPTPFGQAWARLYTRKLLRNPSPTAGEIATIKEGLRTP